mmetsp:Transcript_4851/g.12732  ORF Transcript_4851/g.12732 Transcript_4851/m.12732 type:complete len:268 (-) Transcript_4851:1156-1959(-)
MHIAIATVTALYIRLRIWSAFYGAIPCLDPHRASLIGPLLSGAMRFGTSAPMECSWEQQHPLRFRHLIPLREVAVWEHARCDQRPEVHQQHEPLRHNDHPHANISDLRIRSGAARLYRSPSSQGHGEPTTDDREDHIQPPGIAECVGYGFFVPSAATSILSAAWALLITTSILIVRAIGDNTCHLSLTVRVCRFGLLPVIKVAVLNLVLTVSVESLIRRERPTGVPQGNDSEANANEDAQEVILSQEWVAIAVGVLGHGAVAERCCV